MYFSLQPLIESNPFIISHTAAALICLLLGFVQFFTTKGNSRHKIIGYIWALLMMWVAISSFWIHEIRVLGPWSPIHFLSIIVIVTVPLAVLRARQHKITQHKINMITIYLFALIGAGTFTLLPGRLLYQTLFGG